MKSFFSRLHDTQTGHSKSASRETYKFWIPNPNSGRDSPKPNTVHESAAPVPATRPQAEKRSSSRAHKHSYPIPVASHDRLVPPSNSTTTAPAPQQSTFAAATHTVPSFQHASSTYPQPVSNVTSTRYHESSNDKPQSPPPPVARPSYSTRTWTQQQMPTKSAPQASSSRIGPTSVQHEIWLPTNLPSTSKPIEEPAKVEEKAYPLENSRPHNDDKDRPLEFGKRERERERTRERERERRREKDGDRERVKPPAKEQAQENTRETERTRTRDKERERELAKDAEREQFKERAHRERDRDREPERQRERDRERQKERAREKEREQKERERELREREQRREQERDKEREREQRDRDRERERERRDRERARYYEREKRDMEKDREREKYRPREHDRDREKDKGRDNNGTRGSPSTKLKDSVAEEGLAVRDDLRRTVQLERVKADIIFQDPDLRREKDGRSARDHHRSRKRDGEQRYRAEATDGEQNLRRAKPRSQQPERKEDRQGWVSDTFATHERKTSRQTVAREQPAIDEGEISDNSVQIRIANRARPRYGQVDGNDTATKDQFLLNTTTAMQASNHSLYMSKAPPAVPDSNPPISATPLQMPVHLPSKDSRTTDRPGPFLANEQTTNESTVPIRREINRLKLNSRQEDGRPSPPDPLPKVVDPPSGQQRPPSRAYPSVIPQYLSTSQSASSQPLRSTLELTQTAIGSNQLPSTASRSTTGQIPEPHKGTEQTEGRQGAKKEQYLPTAGSTSKVDLRSDPVGKVDSQNGPSVVANFASQMPGASWPSLPPVTSQKLEYSPKSRRGPNIAALTTGMEQEASDTRHLSPVQTKEASKSDSHSVTARFEQPNPPFSPPPSVPLVNRYPVVGRRELYASPAPVTMNIQVGQVVGDNIEDTRPASRAQRPMPLTESQSNKSSQAPVVSHVHSGPYSHHLPALSQDVGQIATASYAREAGPQASPLPNRDNQAKTATTTHTTSDQNRSVATGQSRIEDSIPVSGRHLLASPSIGVGMNTSGARSDLPGSTAQEKLTTSFSQFPARTGSGTRNSNIVLQHDLPVSGLKSSSRDLQPYGLGQPATDRVHYEATDASLASNQIAQQSSASLRIKVSGGQLRSQDAENPSMPTSSSILPVVIPVIKHESSAPPPAKSTVLDHGSFLAQPAASEQVVESPLSRPQLSSIDPSSPLSRQPRLVAYSEQPHSSIEKATTLSDAQRATNNGPRAGSFNVLQGSAVNPNTMTERPTALEDQPSNNALTGRMNIPNEHTSNPLSNRADNRPSKAAVPRAESSVPSGNLPLRSFMISSNAPRQDKEALPLRSENSAEASLTPRLLASSSFKKESPKNLVHVIHTSSNLSKEAVASHAVPPVRKEESPKARHPEVAALPSTSPFSDLAYGPNTGTKQNGHEISREGRPNYSPKVTGPLKVENATVPPEQPALRREPSGAQLDSRSNYVPPPPVLDQYRPSQSTSNGQHVSDSQLQQTLKPYPLRHEQAAFVNDPSRAPLSPRLATSPSDHPLLSTFSIKSDNAPGAKVLLSPRTAREETTFAVEEIEETPERHLSHKGVVNEEEEDRMSKPLVHDRQHIVPKPISSLPPPPGHKQVFAEYSSGKETPSLGFFTTKFSTALSASAEPKVVEEEPTANIHARSGIERGLSNIYGAGKTKAEAASSNDLHAVSQHKNTATGEYRSEPQQSTGPPSRKDAGANHTQATHVAPTYKISHPVLAEILSSPKPTKQISIPSTSSMLQSTSMNDRPSVSSGVKAEQSKFDNPTSDTQLTNMETSRTQAPPKYPYLSQPRHIPGPTQLPTQDAPSGQDHRTASNSNLPDIQQSRPMTQAMDSQLPAQIPLVAPSTRTLPSSNQPSNSAHPSLLKHGDLLAVASSSRPEGGRIGTNAQMTLPHDRKMSAANPTQKESRWVPSEGYHYSSKVPVQSSRTPASSHMPAPPTANMTSNQAARHQHSASLPTSFPLSSTANPPQKDDPSRTRSPVYQQPHYVPYQTNLVRVNPSGEKTAVALLKAPSEETILMTPSSLAQSTLLKPTTSRQSVTPSISSQTAKKGGIFNIFRKATPQPSTQTPQQYEIWHPNLAAKTPDSSPGNQKPANAHSAVQGTPSTPTKAQTADEFAISVPIHGGDQHQKAARVFTPFRYLTSKKNRAVSVASMEAQDGTAANTVVGSPTASMHSQSVIIPPPLRDPRLATEEWRDKEEAEAEVRAKNKLRRQRPGVVFDVDGDVPEDTQKRPRRRGTRYRKTGKEDDPLS